MLAGALAVLILLLAAYAAGAAWRAEGSVALTCGLGLLAAAIAWSGMFGLLTLPWLLTALTVVAVGGALARPVPADPKVADTAAWTRGETLVLALVGLHLVIHALALAVPPIGWDALTYHLPLPAHYLRCGMLADSRDILNSTFPQAVEMLYLWVLAWAPSGQAALAINLVCLPLLIVLTVKLARALGVPRPWRLLAGLAVLLMPMTNRLAGYHNTDIPLALFSTLALLMLARRQQAAALLVAGMAAACKYTGLIIFAGVLAAVLWQADRRGRLRLLLFAPLALLLTAGPWLLRNAAHTGNPVYPFARAYFEQPAAAPGAGEPAAAMAAVAGQYADKGHVYASRWERLRFPFDITFCFVQFDEWRYAAGPLYLALVPVGLWALRRQAAAPVLVALAHVTVVVLLVPNARYLLPALPCLAAAAALGMAQLAARRRWWTPVLLTLVLGWGVLNLPLALAQHGPNLHLLWRTGYDGFYAAKLPFLDGVDRVHALLHTDRQLLAAHLQLPRPRVCVVDKRVFPLGFDAVSGLQAGMPRPPFVLQGTLPEQAAQLAAALYDRDVRFVTVSSQHVRQHQDHAVANACEYLVAAGYADRVFASDHARVYRLN